MAIQFQKQTFNKSLFEFKQKSSENSRLRQIYRQIVQSKSTITLIIKLFPSFEDNNQYSIKTEYNINCQLITNYVKSIAICKLK